MESETVLKKPTYYLRYNVSTIRQRIKEELGSDFVNFDFMWDAKGDEFVPYITLFNFEKNKDAINIISVFMKRTPILFEASLVYEPKRIKGRIGQNKIDWNEFTKIDKTTL